MSKSGLEYRADIDGLRALAVTVVILFHLDVSWLPGGFIGVDVFFVISGFLITSLIKRRIEADSFSLIDFYERRFRRIYPNLVIVLAATSAVGWITLLPQTYRSFGRTLVWAALSASNFSFLENGGYFDPGVIAKPLLHTWSLGVEEQFYLVFPWLLMLAVRRGYRAPWLIAGTVVLSLALSIVAGMVDWAPSYFMLPTRFWELGMGSMAAVLPLNDRMTTVRRASLGFAGLTGILWACFSLSKSDSFPGYLALAPVLGTTALIIAGDGPVNRVMASPPLAWTGRLSYALYLWHWPLISLGAGVGLSAKDTSTRILVIALSLALSVFGYYLWEMPIRRRRLLPNRRSLFAALSLCVAALVGVGIIIFTAKGFPQRLPKDLLETYKNNDAEALLIMKKCPRDDSKPQSCPIGNDASQHVSFMIIGDSHSEAVAAEIGDVAKQYRLRGLFLGRSACRAFASPTRLDRPGCIPQNDYFIEQYKKFKPELVIVIIRWTEYQPKDYLASSGDDSTYAALERTMELLKDSTVVASLGVPEYGTNISEVSWHNRFYQRMGLSAPPPTKPLGEYRKDQTYVQEFLYREKARHPNLEIVDPATMLCPQGTCISIADGKPLYFDDNHLSHAGALLYASLFKPYFAELAQRLANAPATTEPATAVTPALPSGR